MIFRSRVPAAMLFSVLSACAGSTAPGSTAHTAFTNQSARMTALGLRQVGPPMEGQIARNQTARHTWHLSAGECYRFIALGDSNAMDLEVAVVSPAGERGAAS